MTDTTEAVRLAGLLEQWARDYAGTTYEEDTLTQSAALLRRIPELEAERDKLAIQLNDLTALNEYVKERRAQISHRLWVWAHEELSEPLKTRYFNIVANGTADVMEQPTYAQQFNAMKYRAEASEAERDQLRAELEKVRVPEGWSITLVDGDLIVRSPIQGPGGTTIAVGKPHTPAVSILEALCLALLPAAPTPPHADQKGQ